MGWKGDAISAINNAIGKYPSSFASGLIAAATVIRGLPEKNESPGRGSWYTVGLNPPNYECSKCGVWRSERTRYCPSCGARMDGDGE